MDNNDETIKIKDWKNLEMTINPRKIKIAPSAPNKINTEFLKNIDLNYYGINDNKNLTNKEFNKINKEIEDEEKQQESLLYLDYLEKLNNINNKI